MKVTRAQIYLTEIDRRFPIVLRLWSDEGVFGLGEAAVAYGRGSGAAAALVQDLVGHFVIGCNPFRIERIWTDMYDHSFWAKGGGPIIYAGISAIEMALVAPIWRWRASRRCATPPAGTSTSWWTSVRS